MKKDTEIANFLADKNIPVVHLTDLNTGSLDVLKNAMAILHGPKFLHRERPYNGQEWTDNGKRGEQLVTGLTMRDIRDCFILAYIQSHDYYIEGTIDRLEPNATLIDEAKKGSKAQLNGNDLYSLVGDIDPNAVGQNLGCWIERYMGIYPNVQELNKTEEP